MSIEPIIDNQVPFSAEAVNILVALERGHLGINAKGGYQSGWCKDCFPFYLPFGGDHLEGETCDISCPTLVKARESVSEETKIAVALILAGER